MVKSQRIGFYLLSGVLILLLTACGGTQNVAGQSGSTTVPRLPNTLPSLQPTLTPIPTSTPTPKPIQPGNVLMYRLNTMQYTRTLNDLFALDFAPLVEGFIADPVADGFENIADTSGMGMDDARFKYYYAAAESAVRQVFANTQARNRVITCALTAGTLNKCGKNLLETWSEKIWRAPATIDETDAALNFLSQQMQAGSTAEESFQLWLQAMLVSARFLHHVEIDHSQDNSGTSYPLSAYELANRLAYFLWCSLPDEVLLASAKTGALLNDATLLAQVDRMLDSDHASCLADGLAQQWLHLSVVNDKQLTAADYPGWQNRYRKMMIDETKNFFWYLVQHNRPVTELLDADYTFAVPELATYYGATPVNGNGIDRVSLVNTSRRGLLTQGSILISTGSNVGNAFIKRGVFTLDRLLCDKPPEPPADLDRAGDTNGAACKGCHQYIDPIGVALNHFDAAGAFREVNADGAAIDASGNFYRGAAFDGADEMVAVLKQDPRLVSCTAKKFFAFAHGRLATPEDAPQIQDIVNRWTASGNQTRGLRDLIKTIVTSASFRSRQNTVESL